MRFLNIHVLFTSLCLLSSLHAHTGNDELQVETLAKSTLSWDESKLPSYPEGQPEVTILKITIPAHSKLPLHYHPVINAGVLTKGSLKVVATDGSVLILKEGDALIELVGKIHYGTNLSDEPAEIIVFYAGIKDQPITIKTEH